MIKKIIDKLAKLATAHISSKEEKLYKRILLLREMRTKFYGRQVLKTAKEIGKEFVCINYSTVTRKTIIKDCVNFNGMRVLGGGNVVFGNHFHSGEECLIITHNHNYEGDLIPYDTTYTHKDVIIGDCVWLGSRVTILPGTVIGEGAIIQAGAVVHGEIPPFAIAGGNPAKVFKYRDIEHYKKLQSEGKYANLENCVRDHMK